MLTQHGEIRTGGEDASALRAGGGAREVASGGEGGGRRRPKPGRRKRKPGGRARTAAKRVDLYQEVTDTIIAQLEEGRLPWVQPWGKVPGGTGAPGVALPENAATGRAYSGINVLLLWGAAFERGFPCQRFLTFKQALSLGGCVRKGERGTHVVYADRFTPKDGGNENATGGGGDDEDREVWFLKRYTVFNLSQIGGLPDEVTASAPPLPEREIVPRAEALIAATKADFRIGGDRAYYAPGPDVIQVPPQPAFREQINYYRTCFHELSHWTGHGSRLTRNLTTGFGTKDYAREELVAEMSAAFLCARLGIVPTVRHADYIGSWLEVLREDKRAIFKAASLASKAADFVLAFEDERDGEASA
nr:zincin-like metallopeptidase domain-containing protein [Parvularcula oceani]